MPRALNEPVGLSPSALTSSPGTPELARRAAARAAAASSPPRGGSGARGRAPAAAPPSATGRRRGAGERLAGERGGGALQVVAGQQRPPVGGVEPDQRVRRIDLAGGRALEVGERGWDVGEHRAPQPRSRLGVGSRPMVIAELTLPAQPDQVWRHLREPALISRWFGWDYEGLGHEIDVIFLQEATRRRPRARPRVGRRHPGGRPHRARGPRGRDPAADHPRRAARGVRRPRRGVDHVRPAAALRDRARRPRGAPHAAPDRARRRAGRRRARGRAARGAVVPHGASGRRRHAGRPARGLGEAAGRLGGDDALELRRRTPDEAAWRAWWAEHVAR